MILGFIGVGNIGKAMITGLCTCSTPPEKIVIYDVDEGKCTAISRRFSQIEIAPDNQTLLDRAECVFLCVLPQIAPQVFNPSTVVSHQGICDDEAGLTRKNQQEAAVVKLIPTLHRVGLACTRQ